MTSRPGTQIEVDAFARVRKKLETLLDSGLFGISSNAATRGQYAPRFVHEQDPGEPTFRGIKPNSFDKIVLNFEPSTVFATVNAMSVEVEFKAAN